MSGYYDAMVNGQPVGVVGAYQNAIDAIVPGVAQATAQAVGPGEDYLSALIRTAGQLAMTESQRRLIEAQAENLRRSQPPIPIAQYPRYGVSTTPQWVWLAAAGAAALLFLRPKR